MYEPYVNVTIFGAQPDGQTDSTDAIQEAACLLEESGGIVLFPPGGAYMVSKPLRVGPGIYLTGVGAGTYDRWKNPSKGSNIMAAPGFTGEELVRFDYFNGQEQTDKHQMHSGARHLGFVGPGQDHESGMDGVLAYGGRNFMFSHCHFVRFPGTGLRIRGDSDRQAYGNGSIVEHCHARWNGDRGIYHSGADSVFTSNFCAQNGHNGLQVTQKGCVMGGKFADNGGHGVRVRDYVRVDCVSHDNAAQGVSVGGEGNIVTAVTYGNGA